jgi:hypothetical protein
MTCAMNCGVSSTSSTVFTCRSPVGQAVAVLGVRDALDILRETRRARGRRHGVRGAHGRRRGEMLIDEIQAEVDAYWEGIAE